MYAASGLRNSEHTTDGVSPNVFSSTLLGVGTCNEVLVIKKDEYIVS